jgi:hypothetical protein
MDSFRVLQIMTNFSQASAKKSALTATPIGI